MMIRFKMTKVERSLKIGDPQLDSYGNIQILLEFGKRKKTINSTSEEPTLLQLYMNSACAKLAYKLQLFP